MDAEIQFIKDANPIADVVSNSGVILKRSGKCFRGICPFHEENSPSFYTYPDGGFYCFGCGQGGDVFTYTELLQGVTFSEAKRILSAGLPLTTTTYQPVTKTPATLRQLRLPELDRGTIEEREAFAKLRNIDVGAVHAAVSVGTARFGTVGGKRSIVLLDAANKCAEARTLDGSLYPDEGNGHKSHTLPGSSKNWPVGIAPPYFKNLDGFPTLLLVEGTTDYFAALHFALLSMSDVLPVAILGRGNNISPDALPKFRDKRVRIYPHADDDGGGLAAAGLWASQLQSVNAEVDYFDFTGLCKANGTPVNDLNDCTSIHPNHKEITTELLP